MRASYKKPSMEIFSFGPRCVLSFADPHDAGEELSNIVIDTVRSTKINLSLKARSHRSVTERIECCIENDHPGARSPMGEILRYTNEEK